MNSKLSLICIALIMLLSSFTLFKETLDAYCGKYSFEQSGKKLLSEIGVANDSTLSINSPLGTIEAVRTTKDTFSLTSFDGTIIFVREQNDEVNGRIIKAIVNIPSENLEIEAIKQE